MLTDWFFLCKNAFPADNYYMAQKIRKTDLVEQIFQTTNLPKNEISLVIDSLFTEIKDALCSGSTIELRTFGTFETKLRKVKENSRNPKTGEKVKGVSHNVVVFRAGSELQKRIWQMKI